MVETYFCTLNWNTTDWLVRMAESVEATVDAPHKWIVIDNGSEEGERERLESFMRTQPPRWVVKWLPENVGCVHGYNLAFDIVDGLRPGLAQIVMINTDVTLDDAGWLSRLTTWAEVNPEVGVVGLEHSKGARCASQIFMDDNGNWYVHERRNMGERPRESESVGLGFALLRPAVVEAGLRFDPLYEMYYKQDDDFVFQMRAELGLEAWVYPVDCVHHGRASIETNNYKVGDATDEREFDEMKQENQRKFAEKWAWALKPRRRTLLDEAAHLRDMKRIMAERRERP